MRRTGASSHGPATSRARKYVARGRVHGVESLTATERQVARLAVTGRTNKEIASTLFVTRRTVEMHLTQVYRKLRITGRSELFDVLGDS